MADNEFERTIDAGEKAIGYLKHNQTPAVPRYYEFWYTFAMGHNAKLVSAINNILQTKPSISVDETDQLFEDFLSADRIPEKVGEVGAQVTTELKEVIELINTLASSSGQYGKSLDTAIGEMEAIETPSQLKNIVGSLATATKDMVANTQKMESRLQESKEQIEDLKHALEEIRTESMTDQLTGIANRKKFDEVLEQEMADANISGDGLCLLLTDIDYFKNFNDKYGHQTGDQVLRLVATSMDSIFAKRGLAARYGGEEFAVVLPKVDLDAAIVLAEKLCHNIRNKELYQKSSNTSLGRITLSIGVAMYTAGECKENFIERVDKLLYHAKATGRDRVAHVMGDTDTPSASDASSAA
ncbi:MAG: GGDEF domain-containing protein [Pseudomonadota bacterium]